MHSISSASVVTFVHWHNGQSAGQVPFVSCSKSTIENAWRSRVSSLVFWAFNSTVT